MCAPVSFNDELSTMIDDIFNSKVEDPSLDVWGCEKAEPLRKAIKTHGIKSQSNSCCYCLEENLSENHKVWEVEHILPLSDYMQFAFEPMNVAISCPDCNTLKSNKKISNTKAKKKLPIKSSQYFIVHPHLDTYADHIMKSGLCFYPKTSKGRKTIEICGLLRFVERYVNWENLEEVDKIETEAKALNTDGFDKEKLKSMISDLMSLL